MKNYMKFIYLSYYSYFSTIVMKLNNFNIILKNNNFLNFFYFLKNQFSLNFSQLLDIVVVDKVELNLFQKKRFCYTYVLLSVSNNFRLYISGFLSLFESLPSLISFYSSAD